MLKAPVLKFTDDIPRAQFWFAFEKWNQPAFWIHGGTEPVWAGFTFRVPEEWGKQAAIERARWELGMKEPVVWPALPHQILQWLETHPEEERFRAK